MSSDIALITWQPPGGRGAVGAGLREDFPRNHWD